MVEHKQFRLSPAAYTAMAAVCMHTQTDAEVIYTDVVPDVVIDVPGTGVEIDLDGNGTNDFNFLFTSTNFFASTYWGGFNFYVINAILATPENDHAIAAFSTGGGAYVYPYVIDSGIDIGPSAGLFLQNDYQTLLYQFYAIISSAFYYPIIQAGEWLFGQTDKFVGLQLAEGDSTYYGWVRLTVDPSNRAFTIKDLAFESVAETPIETFFPTKLISNSVLQPELQVYYSNETVFVKLESSTPMNGNIELVSLNGALIDNKILNGNATQLECSHIESGVYLIVCYTESFTITKKIIISGS